MPKFPAIHCSNSDISSSSRMLSEIFSLRCLVTPERSNYSRIYLSSSLCRQHVRGNATMKADKFLPPPTSAYIHLPFCRKRCHYCDFPVVVLGSSAARTNSSFEEDSRISSYISFLCREIEAAEAPIPGGPPIQTVYFGGGTPSLVSPEMISMMLNALNSKFGLSAAAEITMELDPGTFEERKLKELKRLGVNRVSVGVQAFQEEMLRRCGRAHGVKDVMEAIDLVRHCGYDNWSMDLISSLPYQTAEMWEESLRMAVNTRPAHLSVYDLQLEKGTKFWQWFKPGEYPLPSDDQSAMFYSTASRVLADAGYNHYEISSYCRNGMECRHNLAYWQNKSFLGFGLGSASYVGGQRFSRPKKMKDYIAYVQTLGHESLSDQAYKLVDTKELAMDVLMLSLRTARGLDVREFAKDFGMELAYSLFEAFNPFVKSGHVFVLDENREMVSADELHLSLSTYGVSDDRLAFLRLSDPDGFLLSNVLISIGFDAVSTVMI